MTFTRTVSVGYLSARAVTSYIGGNRGYGKYRTLTLISIAFSLLLIGGTHKGDSKIIMRIRRQPSGQFLRRLKAYSEPEEKQPSRIRRYKESDAWLWTEVAAVVIGLAFVIPTAIALWIDLDDRKEQRIAQAWESVTRVAQGNSGKGPALEYLNNQGVRLVGINLSARGLLGGSYLVLTNLPGADLGYADLTGVWMDHSNLSGASLREANLSGALARGIDFSGADLKGANFKGAELSRSSFNGADLRGANLEGADLRNAILRGTILREVNLSGANLQGVIDLSQVSLDYACGDEKTLLPERFNRFTIKACADK